MFGNHTSFTPRKIVLITVAVVTSAGLSVSGQPLLDRSEVANRSTISHSPPQGRNELRFSLTSNGFQPQAAQHSAGTFAIAVDNSVHSADYTLRLKTADGTLLKEVQVQKGSTAFTVELSAGNYVLSEPSNPEWICNLTIL